jgi:SPP1 gp7 family putative phage head morphogenesis protein
MSVQHRRTCGQTANATRSGDPTNTRSLRQAFIDELRRRVRRVRGLTRTSVGYENDALRLRQDAPDPVLANAEAPEEFDFMSDSGRAEQFYRWVKGALRDEVLDVAGQSAQQRGEHWTAPKIRQAYLQGYNQATGLLFQAGASVRNRADETILNLPVSEQQLRRLYTRAYEDLKDITDSAAVTLRQELTTGLAAGENPRQIASRLNQQLESVTRSRLATYARTAIIDSHATATLDRYESAGVDVVSHGEWATADDDRVCRVCEALEGAEFTTQEMRETTFELPGIDYEIRLKPPAHPNGRCVVLPVVGGTPPEGPLDERLPNHPARRGSANTHHTAHS